MVLCGLKYRGAAFCAYLDKNFNCIVLLSTKADPDACYWPAVKLNGFEYYEYILCYIDDILYIPHKLVIALGRIQVVFNSNEIIWSSPKYISVIKS